MVFSDESLGHKNSPASYTELAPLLYLPSAPEVHGIVASEFHFFIKAGAIHLY